jgi:hypothetical protein
VSGRRQQRNATAAICGTAAPQAWQLLAVGACRSSLQQLPVPARAMQPQDSAAAHLHMPQPHEHTDRLFKSRAVTLPFSSQVFNRCNACNLLLSVGLIFFVVRLVAYPSPESATHEEPYPEKASLLPTAA